MLDKATGRGADALIVDFEDAIAPSNKESAREITRNWLDWQSSEGTPTWVRINPDRNGEADLGVELGILLDHTVWNSLRVTVIVASAAAGTTPPIGPVDPDFGKPRHLEAQTRHLSEMGFASGAVIHPAQIEPVHRALTPSTEEVDQARDVMARHENAVAKRVGA